MSDKLIYVNRQHSYDISEESMEDYDIAVTRFIHELVTEPGSCVFDKDYGTDFISNLGGIVNKYKIEYFLEQAFNRISDKHQIDTVTLVDTNNATDGTLEMSILISAFEIKSVITSGIVYTGEYVTETIIENN